MINKPKLVLDTSIIAKWLLPDEQDTPLAEMVFHDYSQNRLGIFIPSIAPVEVINMLKSAYLRKRISKDHAFTACTNFLEFKFKIYDTNNLLLKIHECSFLYNISAYDASYVTLSEYLEIPFYTTDQKLIEKVSNSLVKHLSEYSL